MKYINYRIVAETEKSGVKWYTVQRKIYLFFWKYLDFHKESNLRAFKISFRTIDGAESHIHSDVNVRYQESRKKIISREYI
jgi:hypothetical protein